MTDLEMPGTVSAIDKWLEKAAMLSWVNVHHSVHEHTTDGQPVHAYVVSVPRKLGATARASCTLALHQEAIDENWESYLSMKWSATMMSLWHFVIYGENESP